LGFGEKVNKKRVHICTVECPYCAKILDVLKDVEVITPSQKAEKKETYLTEKSVQMTLSISQ
jgi:hypothetical protein